MKCPLCGADTVVRETRTRTGYIYRSHGCVGCLARGPSHQHVIAAMWRRPSQRKPRQRGRT